MLKGDLARVYNALKRRGRATLPEDLATATGLPAAQVLGLLTQLELKGLVESVGGRYRAVTPKQPAAPKPKPKTKAKAKAREKAASKPVKSRRVCHVLWFDARGRFTRPPKDHREPKKPRIVKRSLLQDVDGNGQAVVTQAGYRVLSVRFVPPRDIRQAIADAKRRGDREYVQSYLKWKKAVEADLAEQAQKELDRQRAREDARALESAYRSEKARKAAKTRARRRAALTDDDRLKARALADALGMRIKSARLELDATRKGTKKAERLRRRIDRWSKARQKLLKIAAGKAYTWPKPSEMR